MDLLRGQVTEMKRKKEMATAGTRRGLGLQLQPSEPSLGEEPRGLLAGRPSAGALEERMPPSTKAGGDRQGRFQTLSTTALGKKS